MFIAEEIISQASSSLFLRYEVKTGIRAAERAPITKILKTVLGTLSAKK